MTAGLFERLGFLILPEFVGPELRRTLLSELEAAPARPATMYQLGAGRRVNEDVRRARWVEPRPETKGRLHDLLHALRTRVQDHFGVPVDGFEEPQFVRYEPGDFFRWHADTDAGGDEEVRRRKVSVVIFLNDGPGGSAPGSYEGGSLEFRLPVAGSASPGASLGVPLPARAGLLAAFPAGVPHQVRPVRGGVRYSAVTWFF